MWRGFSAASATQYAVTPVKMKKKVWATNGPGCLAKLRGDPRDLKRGEWFVRNASKHSCYSIQYFLEYCWGFMGTNLEKMAWEA